jgi:hypothetical protein
MGHKVYRAIVGAIKAGKLNEPFTIEDFRKSCSGLGYEAYKELGKTVDGQLVPT